LFGFIGSCVAKGIPKSVSKKRIGSSKIGSPKIGLPKILFYNMVKFGLSKNDQNYLEIDI
jgi:hypothetical protein